MNNEQYRDLLKFLKNEIDQKWTKRKIRDLQNNQQIIKLKITNYII